LAFLLRFITWLGRELILHFALALPGLVVLQLATLGRCPRFDGLPDGRSRTPDDGGWYAAGVAVGVALWAAAGYALWRILA